MILCLAGGQGIRLNDEASVLAALDSRQKPLIHLGLSTRQQDSRILLRCVAPPLHFRARHAGVCTEHKQAAYKADQACDRRWLRFVGVFEGFRTYFIARSLRARTGPNTENMFRFCSILHLSKHATICCIHVYIYIYI